MSGDSTMLETISHAAAQSLRGRNNPILSSEQL